MTALPSDLLLRLRTDTRPDHEALEQNPFNRALATAAVTAPVVERFLAKMYGFLVPVEAALAASSLGPEWQLPLRRRAHLIRQDLGATVTDALPLCPPALLPPLATPEQLLGALYVVEGATLGGQVIGRALAKAGLPTSAYFTGYGPQTGPLWRDFGHLLTSTATSAPAQDAVVAAARATFQALTAWINQP